MLKIFIHLGGFAYCLFLFLCVKYRNPHKLYFLFGKKGSGKSTFMIKKMITYLKKGWHVYTDIPDVNIFGVRFINAKDLERFTPEYHSALFLDEIGLTFDNRKFKSFPDGVNEWFKFQRKYQVVVYCNSQFADIDLKIRNLIDKMYLCQSIGGVICLIRPIKKNITLTQPSAEAESRIADLLSFEKPWHWKMLYLPRYFKYFNSFSAPQRPLIPYKFIDDGLKVVRGKSAQKLLAELSLEEDIQ